MTSARGAPRGRPLSPIVETTQGGVINDERRRAIRPVRTGADGDVRARRTADHVRRHPLSVALDGARAAIEGCGAQNDRIAVTVVDRSGAVRASLRADGANPHLLEGALRKAYTSAMLRIATTQMTSIIEKNPSAGGLMASIP